MGLTPPAASTIWLEKPANDIGAPMTVQPSRHTLPPAAEDKTLDTTGLLVKAARGDTRKIERPSGAPPPYDLPQGRRDRAVPRTTPPRSHCTYGRRRGRETTTMSAPLRPWAGMRDTYSVCPAPAVETRGRKTRMTSAPSRPLDFIRRAPLPMTKQGALGDNEVKITGQSGRPVPTIGPSNNTIMGRDTRHTMFPAPRQPEDLATSITRLLPTQLQARGEVEALPPEASFSAISCEDGGEPSDWPWTSEGGGNTDGEEDGTGRQGGRDLPFASVGKF